MTIGERIKNMRLKLGMSQVEFADKINVSKQTLYKYENNVITNIPSANIEAAARLGNVSPSYLMGWEEFSENTYSENDKPLFTSRDERDIAMDLNSIMEKLKSREDGPASFEGETIPEADQELFVGQLELMLRRLKAINKEKYNPHNKEVSELPCEKR